MGGTFLRDPPLWPTLLDGSIFPLVQSECAYFRAIGPYVAYSLKDRYHRDPIVFSWGDDSTWDSSTLVGTDQFGDSSESVYQGHRSFDWGMTALVGVEAYRWTTKLQYDLSLGKESRWDQVRANYHTLSLSVGYRFGK